MRTVLASVGVFAWVLLVGALADFHDPYARTAFALGIVAAVPAFLLGDLLVRERRRG